MNIAMRTSQLTTPYLPCYLQSTKSLCGCYYKAKTVGYSDLKNAMALDIFKENRHHYAKMGEKNNTTFITHPYKAETN